MILKYGNTPLTILIGNQVLDFDINRDINIATARKCFNQMIGSISAKYQNNFNYWLLKISERNTLTCDLFLEVCYLLLIKNLPKNTSPLITIITNKPALFYYFKNEGNYFISFSHALRFRLKYVLAKIFWLLKGCYFLFNWSYRHLLALMTRNNQDMGKFLENSCILQTWVNNNNFKNNKYNEGYYGDLADYLQKAGKKVITWPILFRGTAISRTILFLRKHPDSFLLIEDVLHYKDYLKTFFNFFFKRKTFIFSDATINYPINQNYNIFINIESLLNYHLNFEGFEIGSLLYYFCYRLQQLGPTKLTFFQHFENMIPEKGFLLGIKKWLPHAKVIGYFHSTKPRNLLCLEYATLEEYRIAPKPHCVIYNSNLYLNYYKNLFPEFVLKNGYAFKQSYLANIMNCQGNAKVLLILFSGTQVDNELMLNFLKSNLTSLKKYQLIIKAHPMKPINISELEHSNLQYSTEPLPKLFEKVNKVISCYSASLLEAYLYGKLVGFLYDKKRLLLDPFDDTNIHSYQLISCSEDLKHFLLTAVPEITSSTPLFNTHETDYFSFLEVTNEI